MTQIKIFVFSFFSEMPVVKLLLMYVLLANTIESQGNKCKFFSIHGDIHADCSHLNLSQIPDGLPENTTQLDLSYNNIVTIGNRTFKSTKLLKMLNLKNNKVQNLRPYAFLGCDLLTHLDLSWNQIPLSYSSYPSSVFDYLSHLQWLNLQYNTKGLKLF